MIYVASDLHYDAQHPSFQGNVAVRRMAARLNANGTSQDLFCLAGDLGADETSMHECLNLFDGFAGQKCAVAGNHDIWVDPGQDSWEKFQASSKIFRKHGFHALEDEPLRWHGWGVAGTMGWYDYSFGDDPEIPLDAYRAKVFPEVGSAMWSDAAHVHWNLSDEEATLLFARKLAAHLQKLADEKQVLVITHHLPTKDLLFHPRWMVPRQWRFLNAFLGSEQFGHVIDAHANIRCAISGHIHLAREIRSEQTLFATAGSDYDNKDLLQYDGFKLKRFKF